MGTLIASNIIDGEMWIIQNMNNKYLKTHIRVWIESKGFRVELGKSLTIRHWQFRKL